MNKLNKHSIDFEHKLSKLNHYKGRCFEISLIFLKISDRLSVH